MKFILGTKQNMTQIFDEAGTVHPVTVLSVSPLTVTQIKTVEKDGYTAVQVGYGTRNAKNINKKHSAINRVKLPLIGILNTMFPIRIISMASINEMSR